MGKPGRDGAPSPVNPGDSATRQEVRHGGPPTRTWWGGYHLAGPGGPPWPKAVYYPQNQTSNLKPLLDHRIAVLNDKNVQIIEESWGHCSRLDLNAA